MGGPRFQSTPLWNPCRLQTPGRVTTVKPWNRIEVFARGAGNYSSKVTVMVWIPATHQRGAGICNPRSITGQNPTPENAAVT